MNNLKFKLQLLIAKIKIKLYFYKAGKRLLRQVKSLKKFETLYLNK